MVSTLAALKATATSAFVFPGRAGGYYHRFKTHFFAAVRKAGFAGTGLNIHACRHSWASRMIETGADLVLVRDLLGWSDLSLVSRYSHHRPSRAVDATARMLPAQKERIRAPHALVVVGPASPRHR